MSQRRRPLRESETTYLPKKFKTLGIWVTSLIKSSSHSYLINVGLQLTLKFSTHLI